MSKYQAIVFDLDGTAIANSKTAVPSPRLIRTVAKYRDKIHLVAATGRSMTYAMPVISALELTNPCIISGGTIIIDPVTRHVIRRTNIPADAVLAILDIAKNHPYRIALCEEYVDPNDSTSHQHLIDNVEIIYFSQVTASDVPILLDAFGAIPTIAASAVPDWSGIGFAFTITHIDATKEHAVAEVLKSLGIAPEAAIGIGDADNDLHLFRSVGLKIAMGNASEALKAAADLIAPPQDQDGLADIIERYTS